MGMLRTAALISLPILGICATVLYLLHKREEDELQDLEDIKTSRMKTIEMKIPIVNVGVVIGRGGSNIKEIQQKTDTRINFSDRDDGDEYRTCYIRGTTENAQMAESMLHEIIMTQPLIEIQETWIPQRATGRVIGRNGENIRAITRASNAKINIDSSSSKYRGQASENKVVIKGTPEQIAVALSLIQEKVEEDVEVRRSMELCQSSRSPRIKPKSNGLASQIIAPEKLKNNEISESLTATGSDGFLQVFVSAVDTPACFWVQVYSPRSVELDHLLEEMTEYYSLEENRTLHKLREVEMGQIVATPYSQDDKWYRAEVKAVEINNDDREESEVDLYYVDYGDSAYRKKKDVCQLRTDFLKLRFQAIECTLANVKPVGEQWSEKATDLFEELCHVAQWKPLMAKVVSCDQRPRGRREGSPVPSISLFDTSGSEDINISEELVKQGHAVREDSSVNGSLGSPSHRSQSRASGYSTPVVRGATSPEPSSDADSTL